MAREPPGRLKPGKRQWLQPGGWVRLGEVAIDGVVAFVEVQFGSGAIRERRGAGRR
jgi:hypothetical protein